MTKPDSIRPVQRSKHVFMGVFGHPGCGKTRLIGSGGKGTLILRPPTDHTDSVRTPGVDEWVVDDWAALSDAGEYLRGGGFRDYEWAWLDSISLFQDHGLDDIFAAEVARHPHRKEYGVDKGEYKRNMERLSGWVRDVVTLDQINFGFTAHPEYVVVNGAGDIKLGPWIQGKNMAHKIAGYMNVVAYMEVVEQNGKHRRVLRFQETEDYIAKDQFDAFEKGRLVDPTMDKVMERINAVRSQGGAKQRRTTKRRVVRRKGA